MVNVIITLLVASTLLGIFFLSRVVPINFKNLNLLSYQYAIHFIILVVPGSIMILLGNRSDLALLPVSMETVLKCSIAIIWCISSFPLTATLLDFALKQNLKRKIILYKSRAILHHKNPRSTLKNIKYITYANTINLFILFSLIPIIPIFHLGNNADFIMNARIESAFDLPGGVYIFRRILIYFLPIFFLYTIAFNNIKKVPRKIIILSLFNAFMILGYSTEKAPIIFLIFSYFYMKNISSDLFNFSLKKILTLVALALFLLLGMFVFFYQNRLEDAFESLISRLFVSQISGSYLSMEYYGNIGNFKGFDAVLFRLDSLLHNNITMQASEELVYYYYPDLFNSNLWRNVNSFIIQGAWSNFGWFGILIAPIWCAMIMYFSMIFVVKTPKTSSTMAIYTYSSIFMVSPSTNFNNFIFSSGFILTIVIWLFLRKL